MNYLKVTIQILVILTIGISLMFVVEQKEIAKKKVEAEILARQLQLEKEAEIAKIAEKAAQNPYRDKVEEAIETADIVTITSDEMEKYLSNTTPETNDFGYEKKTKVSFTKQGLTEIDEATLKPYRNCKLLDLSNNQFQELPIYISKMDYLEILILDNNQLTELPYFLQNCRCLKIIYAGDNPIKKISCNLLKMTATNLIELQNTQFTRLPKFPDRAGLSIILTAKDYGNIKIDDLDGHTEKRYKYTNFEFL
jgi:Leucine-rich repeat (LRR) protein